MPQIISFKNEILNVLSWYWNHCYMINEIKWLLLTNQNIGKSIVNIDYGFFFTNHNISTVKYKNTLNKPF